MPAVTSAAPLRRVRTLTGMSARTAAPSVNGSPRVIIQRRSAPVTTASTTSFTVPPQAARTARWSANVVRAIP